MNVFDEHPFKVLFDYGHNAHAVGMLADLAQRLDVNGRRIVVLAGPGDRRDEDLLAIADAVAGRFDHYICRRDDNLRDRARGRGAAHPGGARCVAAGVREDAISIIPDEQEAIDAALRMGRQGDLLLVFADALVRSWKQVTKFRMQGASYSSPAGEPAAVPGDAASAGTSGLRGAMPDSLESEVPPRARRPAPGELDRNPADAATDLAALNLDGLIRDERGVRFAPESDD